MEIWKDVKGYEGLYQISNLGNLKSLVRRTMIRGIYNGLLKEKILKTRTNIGGYFIVGLRKNNFQKTYLVHQLVAIAFLGHKPNGNKIVINHKNFIRTDNRLENIEIVTNRENTNKKHLKSSSKYTGVHWCKRDNVWISQICINSKQKRLGAFKNEIDAKNAYIEDLKRIKKEVQLLNKTL